MEAYYLDVKKLKASFNVMELHHIPQKENEEANNLARLGSTQDTLPSGAFLDILTKPSIRLDAKHEEPPKESTQASL